MDNTAKDPKEKNKTGVVPAEEISGSDADKAYDQDGNFVSDNRSEEQKQERSGIPQGSDADSADQ